MFKKFIQRIIDTDKESIVESVFYGEGGIDLAFQRGKITAAEYIMLWNLIDKISDDKISE